MEPTALAASAPVTAPTGASRTLPTELAKGAALHCLVRIELTNGTKLVGRITDMDPVTMNMKVDALSYVAVRRQFTRHPAKPEDADTSDDAKVGGSGASPSSPATLAVTYDEEEDKPVALRCVNSLVLRGATIRYMDFISEEATGGRGLEDILAVASAVMPS